MPILTQKRQVTLPKSLCDRLGLAPGDPLQVFEYQGHITLLKKQKNASKGIASRLRSTVDSTDEESLLDALERR